MKLAINNKTKYRTSDIRKLFMRCYKESGIKRHTFHLVVIYQRGWIGGRATVGGSWMQLNFFNPERFMNELRMMKKRDYPEQVILQREARMNDVIAKGELLSNPESVAETIMHEFQHNKGLRHCDMVDNFDVSFAKDFDLRLQEEKLKVVRNIVSERYEKAVANYQRYDVKLRRMKNLHKKWARKVKYYEKAVASKKLKGKGGED